MTGNKWCIVPLCRNTSTNSPGKIFANVPKNEKRRRAWMRAIRRAEGTISVKSVCFVCEDHFILEQDMENYMEFKLMPNVNVLIKKDVVPHIFNCQSRTTPFLMKPTRGAYLKRQRKRLVEEAILSFEIRNKGQPSSDPLHPDYVPSCFPEIPEKEETTTKKQLNGKEVNSQKVAKPVAGQSLLKIKDSSMVTVDKDILRTNMSTVNSESTGAVKAGGKTRFFSSLKMPGRNEETVFTCAEEHNRDADTSFEFVPISEMKVEKQETDEKDSALETDIGDGNNISIHLKTENIKEELQVGEITSEIFPDLHFDYSMIEQFNKCAKEEKHFHVESYMNEPDVKLEEVCANGEGWVSDMCNSDTNSMHENSSSNSETVSLMPQLDEKTETPQTDQDIFSECNVDKCQSSHNSSMMECDLSEDKSFTCILCDRRFSRQHDLKRHVKVHMVDRPYACSTCHKRFYEMSDLTLHSKIHTEPKPYACSLCNKSFFQKSHLSKHTKLHVQKLAYKCPLCDAKFDLNYDLSEHLRSHRDKPYVCRMCKRKFARKYNFKQHCLSHTKRTCMCLVCYKIFRTQEGLSRHEKFHLQDKDNLVT